MSRTRWLVLISVLLPGIAASGPAQGPKPPSGEARRIDGSKTPEQIPDSFAYAVLFRQLAAPPAARSRPSFLSRSGLNEADAGVVIRGAERYAEAMAEVDRVGRGMMMSPGQRPSPAQRSALEQAHQHANQVMADILRSLRFDLSPEGKTKLDSFVLEHIKRNTSMTTAGSASPPPAGSAAPATSSRQPVSPALAARRGPDVLGGAANEAEAAALMDAASQALHIIHRAEQDTGTVVELWNASTKGIDVVRVAVCAPGLYRQSGMGSQLDARSRIAPGATAKLHISNAGSPSCDPMTPKVAAVVFEDGTAAGLPALIRQIKLETLGQVAETERIGGLVEAAGDAPHIPTLLEKIGLNPSGDFETVRAAYAGVLPASDKAAIETDDPRVESRLISGMGSVRASIRFRLEQLAANPVGGVDAAGRDWTRIREGFRERVAAAREYRERVGTNLYP